MLAHRHHCSRSTNSTAEESRQKLLSFCVSSGYFSKVIQVRKDDGPDKRAESVHVGLER